MITFKELGMDKADNAHALYDLWQKKLDDCVEQKTNGSTLPQESLDGFRNDCTASLEYSKSTDVNFDDPIPYKQYYDGSLCQYAGKLKSYDQIDTYINYKMTTTGDFTGLLKLDDGKKVLYNHQIYSLCNEYGTMYNKDLCDVCDINGLKYNHNACHICQKPIGLKDDADISCKVCNPTSPLYSLEHCGMCMLSLPTLPTFLNGNLKTYLHKELAKDNKIRPADQLET